MACPAGDRDRRGRRDLGGGHLRGVPVPCDPTDHHQHHVALGRGDDLRPHRSAATGTQYRDVAEASLDESPRRPPPAARQHVAGIAGHHLDQVRVREPIPELLARELGDLQLAEHVLGSRRAPVGAQADLDPLRARGGDVGGRAVEPQVGERRPHHPTGIGLRPGLPVRGADRVAVDPDEGLAQTACVGGVGELPGDHRAHLSLGAVVDEPGALVFHLRHLAQPLPILGERRGVDQIAAAASRRFRVDVAKHLQVGPARGRPPLNRRGASHQGAHLHVRQQGLGLGMGQHRRRLADRGAVRRGPGPAVVVREGNPLLGFGPQRERVVGEMVVQVDDAGQHQRVPHVDDGNSGVARRSGGALLGHRVDASVVAEVHTTRGSSGTIRPAITSAMRSRPGATAPCERRSNVRAWSLLTQEVLHAGRRPCPLESQPGMFGGAARE